jgi:hypothetical protein
MPLILRFPPEKGKQYAVFAVNLSGVLINNLKVAKPCENRRWNMKLGTEMD